jgi:acetoin utilization protein AcuB
MRGSMNASEIMTTTVTSVRATDTVAKAMELLGNLEVRHLPVLDGGELVGMLSDRDVRDIGLNRIADLDASERLKALRRTRVSDLMSANVLSVEPSTDLRELIDMMVEEKVGAVPVVDQHTGALVGIVSYVDVLRAAAKLFD